MSPLYYRSKNLKSNISQHRKSNIEQLNNIFQKSAKTLRPKSQNDYYEGKNPQLQHLFSSPEQKLVNYLETTIKHNLNLTNKKYIQSKNELTEEKLKFKKFNNFNRRKNTVI